MITYEPMIMWHRWLMVGLVWIGLFIYYRVRREK